MTLQICRYLLIDNVAGNMYVLDFLSPAVGDGHQNVSVFAAVWGMNLVPLIGRILSEPSLDGATSYDISHSKVTCPAVIKN